jgi:hypothetical protein
MSFGPRLNEIFDRKKAALYAESQRLADEALKELQDSQRDNAYWNNETKQALQRLFSDAFMDDDAVGFFLAHGVEYGIYLELANDRKHEALRPMAEKYALKLKLFAEGLYA